MINGIACVLTCVLFAGAMLWYCPLILRNRVSPVPATWIIGAVGMDIAAWAFLGMPGRSLTENISLLGAAVEITIVLAVVLYHRHRSKAERKPLDAFQWSCLALMVLTVDYWRFGGGSPVLTYWTVQSLLILAYAVNVVRAISLKRAFDSIGNWLFIFGASLVGTIPAYLKHSPYALGNSARAVLSSLIMVSLLLYFDKKQGWPRWRDEIDFVRRSLRLGA